MSGHATIVKVFISSPSDLLVEQRICTAVVERLNKDPFIVGEVALKVFAWDDPNARIPILASLTPQDAINRGMLRPRDVDIFVAMFWSRMGTPLPHPHFQKSDGTPFLSGTEWELYDALESWKQKSKPEILIYRCDRPPEDTSQMKLLDQFFEDIGPNGAHPISGMVNRFTDAEDFRFQFDYHLRILLRQILGEESIHSHSVPVALPLDERTPSMNILISRFDNCNIINGHLQPCKYHHDRLEVEFYEQKDCRGERDIDNRTVELTPTNSVVDLFERMQHKKMVAGHWGLMACHRQWLISHLEKLFRARARPTLKTLNILQLGVASPVHYFGTTKLVAEAAKQANLPVESTIGFYTYDRCLTPVAAVRSVLSKIETIKKSKGAKRWGSVEALGLKRTLDPSVYKTGADREDVRRRISHHIEVGDICDVEGFLEGPKFFDVAMSHFTFSMWQDDCDLLCKEAFENLAATLKPGASVLAALSEVHNPSIRDVGYYHDQFAKAGFKLVDECRVWDVYDLSYEERERFLSERKRQRIEKRAVLAEYQLA